MADNIIIHVQSFYGRHIYINGATEQDWLALTEGCQVTDGIVNGWHVNPEILADMLNERNGFTAYPFRLPDVPLLAPDYHVIFSVRNSIAPE